MPPTIEHDDECTVFEPKPWGAQQRLLPKRNFMRMSGPLQAGSIATLPALQAPAPGPSQAAAVTMTAEPVPALPSALHDLAASTAVVFAPAVRQFEPMVRHIQRAWTAAPGAPTTLSRIGAPLGIALWAIAMLVGYFAQPAPRAHGSPFGALAGMSQHAGPWLPTGLPAHRAEAARDVIAALAAPASAPAVRTMPVESAPVETAPAAVAIEEIELGLARTTDADVEKPARSKRSAKARPAKKATSSRKKKPRKIVAVDSSTPLGNLRPRRF